MMIDMSRRQALKLAGAGLAMCFLGSAYAGTPVVNPPQHLVAFGSQTPSSVLSFGPGQTATVIGKFISSTATTGAAILCNGCAGVNIQNSDFDVEGMPTILIQNAGTPANPIPVTILHNRCKNPVVCIKLTNVTAAPSSAITHNMCRGITSKFQSCIAVSNNSGGLDPSYCTAHGLNVANCVLGMEYNHMDGRDPATNADPVYPLGSVGLLVGNGATLPSTGHVHTIYNTCLYCGAIGQWLAGGTDVTTYYNKYYNTPDISGAIAGLVVMKDSASVLPAVPPSNSVNYFVMDDETGHLKGVIDDGSMGNSTYLSNVDEDVNLNGDLNSTVAPE